MTYEKNKRLSPEGFEAQLKTKILGRDLHFFEEISSTFEKTKECKVSHGSIVCARRQTNGRGRLGRQWSSGDGGVYFSLILKPRGEVEIFQIYTLLSGLGVQRALSAYLPCFVKWPNDIVSKEGKKLCGILAKLEFSGNEPGLINVGIGINVNTESFDDELKYASSLSLLLGEAVDENSVLADCLYEIEKCLEAPDLGKITDEFSRVCINIGARVRAIYANGTEIRGVCKGVDLRGALIVEKDDGTCVHLNSGEVSVRGIYGENYV